VNSGQWDKEFLHYKNWAIPSILAAKEKISEGTGKLERNLNRKIQRKAKEELKMKEKLMEEFPEEFQDNYYLNVVIFYHFCFISYFF
jgi:hypothetical protein